MLENTAAMHFYEESARERGGWLRVRFVRIQGRSQKRRNDAVNKTTRHQWDSSGTAVPVAVARAGRIGLPGAVMCV